MDCTGKIVLPGFICSHHHFYSTMARGMSVPGAPASNFVEILERMWWKVDRALEEEDILLSAQLPLIDCIRNGTTPLTDGEYGKRVLEIIHAAYTSAKEGKKVALPYASSAKKPVDNWR